MVQSAMTPLLWFAMIGTLSSLAQATSSTQGAEDALRHCNSNLRVDCLAFQRTALDDYVAKPDPHYNYRYIEQRKGDGYTVHLLNMTSLKWLNESVVSNPIWWHVVSVVVPDTVTFTDSAFLWVGHGSNKEDVPQPNDQILTALIHIAITTGTVLAQVQQIPNQPVVFKSDPDQVKRKEDAVLAWCWMLFVKQDYDPTILPRLPMTKAVVRAMDTVTSFVKNVTGKVVDRYMVAGASKRGWVTWTTAAVDKRVVAMAPVVMDLLNFRKSMHHHFRSLGGWTLAFKDYYKVNFTAYLDLPRTQAMMDIEDPNVYNSRYTMPKLVISATGDEFFLPDDSYYYYNTLTGPKHIRMVPNTEHTLVGQQRSVVETLTAFWLRYLTQTPIPKVTWSIAATSKGSKITVRTSEKPVDVTVFHAKTLRDGRRDFRLFQMGPNHQPLIHPIVWYPNSTSPTAPMQYEAHMDNPSTGFVGFFIQMTFGGPKNTSLIFTTETSITPNTFPFPDCKDAACKGTLV